MAYSAHAHAWVWACARTHTLTRTHREFVTQGNDPIKTTGGLEKRHKTQRDVDEAERCTLMRLAADKADLHRHRAACLSLSLSLSSLSIVSRVHSALVCCLP